MNFKQEYWLISDILYESTNFKVHVQNVILKLRKEIRKIKDRIRYLKTKHSKKIEDSIDLKLSYDDLDRAKKLLDDLEQKSTSTRLKFKLQAASSLIGFLSKQRS